MVQFSELWKTDESRLSSPTAARGRGEQLIWPADQGSSKNTRRTRSIRDRGTQGNPIAWESLGKKGRQQGGTQGRQRMVGRTGIRHTTPWQLASCKSWSFGLGRRRRQGWWSTRLCGRPGAGRSWRREDDQTKNAETDVRMESLGAPSPGIWTHISKWIRPFKQ